MSVNETTIISQERADQDRDDFVTQKKPEPTFYLNDANLPNVTLADLYGLLDMAVTSVSEAEYGVFFVTARIYRYAGEHHDEWKAHHNRSGHISLLEDQILSEMLERDPDYENLKEPAKRKRRQRYKQRLTWFTEHPMYDATQVIKEAVLKGWTKIEEEGDAIRKGRDSDAKKAKREEDKARRQKETAEAKAREEEAQRESERTQKGEVARQHREREEREQAVKREAEAKKAETLRRVFLEREPLPPPPKAEAVETPQGTVLEPFEIAPQGNPGLPFEITPQNTVSDVPELSTAPEPESEAEQEVADDPQPAALSEIAQQLRSDILPQDDAWALARFACELIEKEGITPDQHSKPNVPASLLAHVIDPDTMKPSLFRVLDLPCCATALMQLIEERRQLAVEAAKKAA